MSVDTRTPRTPTGGSSSGFDEAPALSMVKVPSDPAQVIVAHASFRVQLPAAGRIQSPRISRHLGLPETTVRLPAVGEAARRRAPVVWSGKSAPDDTGAIRLLQAVRGSSVRRSAEEPGPYDGGATQVIPRFGVDEGPETTPTPAVVGPRAAAPQTQLLPQMRLPSSDYDERLAQERERFDDDAYDHEDDEGGAEERRRRRGNDPVRHAYYPGRRMNLGVVLLPLRVFLGFISIYAGMGKLCDPVYFDGGERGSMVKWLHSLHPWALAEPLRDFALQHPVGAGLTIAFLQVLAGVLTVLGLWQRVAASVGVLLSAALIVTVSWKTVPAYDAPDIIYLAAWSPLIIAGAPVYSVDGRLAGEAWRTLGPRADIWDLRRRVLRRGALIGGVAIGLTLLLGSLLGGAVRDADRIVVPGPGESPRNELPGSPLPGDPAKKRQERKPHTPSASPDSPTQGSSAQPSQGATAPGAAPETGTVGSTQPSQVQGSSTAGQAPPQQSAPQQQRQQQQQPPAATAGPATSGGSTGGGGTGGAGGSASGGSGGERPGGLLGGVLGR
ncbi:DoxX family protein [Streptomyces sp. NPDC005898]|uniref:DoxX family protein n=1 Tax=Streptomyces sp. NPDC005898 TaxID=3157082 RepID=UPI0033C8B990